MVERRADGQLMVVERLRWKWSVFWEAPSVRGESYDEPVRREELADCVVRRACGRYWNGSLPMVLGEDVAGLCCKIG